MRLDWRGVRHLLLLELLVQGGVNLFVAGVLRVEREDCVGNVSIWRSKEKSFLTGLPVALLSTVRRLKKANVAACSVAVGSVAVGSVAVGSVTVFIGVSSALVVLDFGLDWSMKWGRLVRMDRWIDSALVCTIEVIVDVKPCCSLARMVCVVVVECSICSVVTVEMT